jgi:aminoglycoside phosphotransferase (APT) family kinase protein
LSRSPRVDLALNGGAVLALLGNRFGRGALVRDVRLLKRTPRRLVVRYEFRTGSHGPTSVIGKWFSTDRGAIVADALSALRTLGFAGPEFAVPAPLAYLPDVRALFVEEVEGPLLRELLRGEQPAAARAGAWLAAFHSSRFSSSRQCGPSKQARAVVRWSTEEQQLEEVARDLPSILANLPDPGRPVHYDYYHSQLVVPIGGPTTVFDLDEAGLGDPAFDVAHFEAHLELLALQWLGDPGAFAGAGAAFRAGYEQIAPLPEPRPVLSAFAWFKLAHQLLHRHAHEREWRHAVTSVRRSLSAA